MVNSVIIILVLCVVFCRSLFVRLSFVFLAIVLSVLFFWPLCCLSFFDIRILISPLVSSNSSYSQTIKLV